MERRDLLRSVAALPLAGMVRRQKRADRIVVVGAGVLGAATAYRLARRGAQVTICERDTPAAGASGRSGAWLNAYASKLPRHYHDLSHSSVLEWSALEDQVPGLDVNWCGRVEWRSGPEMRAEVTEATRRQQSWGYPIELLEADALSRVAPLLRPPEDLSIAVHARGEGTVHPTGSVRALVKAAEAAGVEVRLGCEVSGIRRSGNTVTAVTTSDGDVEADVVVVTAGVDTPALASMVGVRVPLLDAPGVLAHARSNRDPGSPIIVGPDVGLLPYAGGEYRLLGGFTGKIDYSPEKPESERVEAERLMDLARIRFDAMDSLRLTDVTVGWRPLPEDGHPVIGFPRAAPGVYLMVTHSGFTLAALLSRLAASEILDGIRADQLTPYRVERFA